MTNWFSARVRLTFLISWTDQYLRMVSRLVHRISHPKLLSIWSWLESESQLESDFWYAVRCHDSAFDLTWNRNWNRNHTYIDTIIHCASLICKKNWMMVIVFGDKVGAFSQRTLSSCNIITKWLCLGYAGLIYHKSWAICWTIVMKMWSKLSPSTF